MSATYNEMLKRLIEERKRLGLSQQQMARLVHITQSNYSKVEKGLHRLSYEELKYLSKANIDIFYIFTGYRCAGKYVAYFQQCAYVELCCYLGIIYLLIVLNDCRSNTEQWKDIVKRVKYVPLVLDCKKSSNIFLVIMLMCGKVTNDNLIDSSHYFRNTDQYEKLMWGFSYISFCLSKHFWESDVFVSFLLTASL